MRTIFPSKGKAPVSVGHPVYFEKIAYNLRGGFLVRPLVIAVSLGAAGAVLSDLEENYPVISRVVPRQLFPSRFDHQVTQTILATIASSVMTVVSIVFAILLMTLTLASMQFSPRILVSFTKDRVTQWTLGVFLGTFSYCLCALPAARSVPTPFSPVTTTFGAMVLALVSVVWLLFFIHHISQSISVNYIVDRIATETEEMIDEMMPWPTSEARGGRSRLKDTVVVPPAESVIVKSPAAGYIRHLNVPRMVRIAFEHRVTVLVLRRIGHFVPAGVPLFSVARADRMTPSLASDLLSTFDIGPTRTLQQDVEFGILQIVDIALRAISPAVNDPSTAICCIDHLSRILIRAAGREGEESLYYYPAGKLRVTIPVLGLERLVHSAFDQIRVYSKGDAAVCLRMLRALTDTAASTEDPEAREMLAVMARRIVAGAEAHMEEEELPQLRRRLAQLESLASQRS